MAWRLTTDLAAHERVARPLLGADPVAHTVPLTLLAQLRGGVRWSGDAPVLAHHTGPGGGRPVDAVAMTTPPHPLVVSTGSAVDDAGAAGDRARAALELPVLVAAFDGRALSGVTAVEPVAAAVAAAWAARRGGSVHEEYRLRLHVLGALVDPPATGAHVRAATAADADVVAALVDAMRAELGETGPLPRRILDDRVAEGAVHLLEVGGRAVAVAGATTPVAGVARIGTVYTDPEHRRHGYAAAVTAACARSALRRGARRVCLFTDADDPTPNGVYARLGFVAVGPDRVRWRFDGGPGA